MPKETKLKVVGRVGWDAQDGVLSRIKLHPHYLGMLFANIYCEAAEDDLSGHDLVCLLSSQIIRRLGRRRPRFTRVGVTTAMPHSAAGSQHRVLILSAQRSVTGEGQGARLAANHSDRCKQVAPADETPHKQVRK